MVTEPAREIIMAELNRRDFEIDGSLMSGAGVASSCDF